MVEPTPREDAELVGSSCGRHRNGRLEMTTVENLSQHNQSFLARSEQRLVQAIIARLPSEVTPLQLTRIGWFGAVVTVMALIGCRWSALWLPLVPVGVFLNWFGITLDGPLARHRKEESPRFGLSDHLNDLFSQL